jgi:ribonucleoside-diphosphate reductase alpha chain
VVDQLAGIGGSSSAGFGAQRVRSLADAVAKVVREHQMRKNSGEHEARRAQMAAVGAAAGVLAGGGDGAAAAGAAAGAAEMFSGAAAAQPSGSTSGTTMADMCPDCGNASLRFIEGCQKCEICGYSKC